MADIVTMTLGGYSFDPVPTMSISKEFVRTTANCPVSVTKTATLEGIILVTKGAASDSPIELMQLMEADLCNCESCVRFTIACQGDTILDAYVTIESINFEDSGDAWTTTIPYSISLSWDVSQELTDGELPTTSDCEDCLTSIGETWNFQPLENFNKYSLRNDLTDDMMDNPTECSSGASYVQITRSLSAQGKECKQLVEVPDPMDPMMTIMEEQTLSGWQIARNWICDKLTESLDESTFDSECAALTEFDLSDPASRTICNHSRTIDSDKCGGSYGATDTWLVSNDPMGACQEEWTVSNETQRANRTSSYSIQGTITGCEVRDADFNVTTTKIESAKACWDTVQSELVNRIQCAYDVPCAINAVPVQFSVTTAPSAGTITYNATYDDTPITFVDGAITEQINITDTKASEVISEIPIIARTAGPILSSCGTTLVRKKTASINVVFPLNSTCIDPALSVCDRYQEVYNTISGTFDNTMDPPVLVTPGIEQKVEEFLAVIENQLIMANDFVARTNDTCSSSIVDCQYTRNVEWTYQSCDHTLPVAFDTPDCVIEDPDPDPDPPLDL